MGDFSVVKELSLAASPTSIALVDINDDSSLDLVATTQSPDNVLVMLMDGVNSVSAAKKFAVGMVPTAVVIGDFNADNRLDLAVANKGSGDVSILAWDGMGGLGELKKFKTASVPSTLGTGDFNGDGAADLAVGHFNDEVIFIFHNNCPIISEKDFSLNFAPSTLNVTRGQKGLFTININRIGGFVDYVKVTAPDTKALNINLQPIEQSTMGKSLRFRFKIKHNASIGMQELTFAAQDSSGRMRTAIIKLVVK
jgi:hypothetical protein